MFCIGDIVKSNYQNEATIGRIIDKEVIEGFEEDPSYLLSVKVLNADYYTQIWREEQHLELISRNK